MNYMQIDKTSISNGLGVRVVLFCSGCTQQCQGCFNPETWDFGSGKLFDDDVKEYLFALLNRPYIKGLTISGGHPLETRNMLDIYNLLIAVKEKFPEKDIWLYTGLTLSYDQLTLPDNVSFIPKIAGLCDVIVDGPYVEEQRDITLAFRGSKNQRLIDVKETFKQGKIITIQN